MLHSTMLVETATKNTHSNFNRPAGLHLWSNSKSSAKQQQQPRGLYISHALVYWIVGNSVLGPLVEEHDDRVQQPI